MTEKYIIITLLLLWWAVGIWVAYEVNFKVLKMEKTLLNKIFNIVSGMFWPCYLPAAFIYQL